MKRSLKLAVQLISYFVLVFFAIRLDVMRPVPEAIALLGMGVGPAVIQLLMIYAVIFLSTLLHECGHLVMGLLSGYEFAAFRVGRLEVSSQNGRLALRRIEVPVAAGQCAMFPPKDGSLRFAGFLAGGVLVNLLCAAAGFAVAASGLRSPVIVVAGFYLFVVNAHALLLNAIPWKSLNNDGMKLYMLSRYPEERAYYMRLMQFDNYRGMRLTKMPDALFEPVPEEDLKLAYGGMCAVNNFSRFVDQMDLESALTLGEILLEKGKRLGMHRGGVAIDLLYCELVGQNRPEVIEYLENELKNYPTAYQPIVKERIDYVCALLKRNNPTEAWMAATAFEKQAAKYPDKWVLENERELMAYAKEVHRLRSEVREDEAV